MDVELTDALLADLQSSVGVDVDTKERKWESHTTTETKTITPSSSRVVTDERYRHQFSHEPPPLPPLPPKEILDRIQDSQMKRDCSPSRPIYSSTITISKCVYDSGDENDPHGPYRNARSVSPAYSRPSTGTLMSTDQYGGGYQGRQPPNHAKPSLLSNNLSELDGLLEDLNTTKFYADVHTTNQRNDDLCRLSNGGGTPSGTLRPGSAQKIQRELEIPKLIVPPDRQPMDFSVNHYEEVDACRGSLTQLPVVMQQQQFVQPQRHQPLPGPSMQQLYNTGQSQMQPQMQEQMMQPQMQQIHTYKESHTIVQPGTSTQPIYAPQQTLPIGQNGHVIQSDQGQVMFQQPGQGQMMVQTQGNQGQVMVQHPGQGQMIFQSPGQGLVNQTIVDTYKEERFIKQPAGNQSVVQLGQQGDSMAGGTGGASRDLEDLMMSFSEFDTLNGPPRFGEPLYAQPMKRKLEGNNADQSDGSITISSATPLIQVSQDFSYGGLMATGAASSSPHEMIIQASSSAMGHPVPPTMFTEGSSKLVVTHGSHGVFPNSVGGQSGDGQSLEMMIGKLGNDLNQQGVLTIPKGDCAACNKTIVGQVLLALGKIWHPEHFNCAHCKKELGTDIFFERDGLPYCEHDYQMLFSPKCALCNGTILETCITAMNRTWHPDHFFCTQCHQPFGEEGYHEKDGQPFCREDYFRMFAPKCGGCGQAILSNYVTALHRQWHPECFVCHECQASFDSGSFFDHNGLPYCEQHFHAQRGSLCSACRQPIMGRCIAAMYRKFHPEHFVCVYCLQPLNKGTFKENSSKPYCHECFDKLFG